MSNLANRYLEAIIIIVQESTKFDVIYLWQRYILNDIIVLSHNGTDYGSGRV